jgi:ADP-heptose:LPS heptosyltransferase
MTTSYLDRLQHQMTKYELLYADKPVKFALKLIGFNLKFLLSSVRLFPLKPTFHDGIQHIGIEVVGGVGDLTISAKYVSALKQYLGDEVEFDIISLPQELEIARAIFSNVSGVVRICSQKDRHPIYDAVIYLVRFPRVKSVFFSRLLPKTQAYVQKLQAFEKGHMILYKNDYLGRTWSQLNGRRREDQADIDDRLDMAHTQFTLDCPKEADEVLAKFGLFQKRYIVLQTGAGRHFEKIKQDTRQWPASSYETLVGLYKKRFPDDVIVQVGQITQTPISNVDQDLRGKTTFDELLCLLANAALQVSQEGGMAILRHFLGGGKSVVLFGPTDETFFGFKENINLSARKCAGCCEWIVKDWMAKCPKTGQDSLCMRNLPPETVMKEIEKEVL